MHGFGKDERIPVLLDKVVCTGTETHLSMCTNAVPTGECSAVGVTCGKSSSEVTNTVIYIMLENFIYYHTQTLKDVQIPTEV